ncbi:M90 family metallopeptidase [Psychrobacter lutiphocae]|uniref:M90 family metallopeptidase n=1 Tax=Psychrobacter lutiphocae TaxID=540500 RepID=UPI000370227D|nr:M90 family metallopeptidase [Psychrobacter lutiphocae]
MLDKIKDWHQQRIIDNSPYSLESWHKVAQDIDILNRLTQSELEQLIELAILLLHEKKIQGAQGLEITQRMKQSIALQACLPILNLGLEWYKGWSSIIVYPGSYFTKTSRTDEFGIVHEGHQHRSGEAWLRGPVILSWRDVKHAGARDGNNVVIHEFVHKLDMLNGRANGFPPMQKGMNPAQWTQIMEKGFADFQHNPKAGINSYGATNPAELIAVLSEVFFERPEVLQDAYPDIYQLMVEFFKQNPL